jgi:hypothetical protein
MDNMDTRPADIRAQVEQQKTDRQVGRILDKPAPTPTEKVAVNNAVTATMFAAQLTGAPERDAAAAGVAVRAAGIAAPEESVNALTAALPGNSQLVDVAAGLNKSLSQLDEKAAKAQVTGFGDQLAAGFSEMTAIPALLRRLERPTVTADPTFDYMSIRDKAEANRPEEDRKWLRESESEADLNQRILELKAKDERLATLGAHGTTMAVAAGLTGGFVDPVGWVATLGVGKVAQMAGIGARVAMLEGQLGKSVAYGALEGAAGNVLTEAALDAAGGHVTFSDYVTAAGMGTVFGQMHLLSGRPKTEQAAPDSPAPRRTDMETGADYTLKDGTPVVATRTQNEYGEIDITLHTPDGVKVGEVNGSAAEHGVNFPQPHVEEGYRRRGANTLMYDLLDETGGYTGTRDNTASARTSDGIAFWNTYEKGQSKAWRDGTPVGPRTPKEAAEDINAKAAQQNMDLYTQAQARAGADATPEDIRVEADNIMREQADSVNRIAFSEVPEQDRMMPLFDLEVREDGTVPSLDEVMQTPEVRTKVSDRWGINMHTVEDGTERKMMAETAARAEGWDRANPVDPERINSILARTPWLASSGLLLAKSENPVARMIAGVLLESSTGATGRRRTAAITKTMRERVYLEDLVGYEESYKQWRKQNGGSGYRDVIGSDHRSRFDRLVAADRENRRLGVAGSNDVSVRRAGDHLDSGYDRMRRDQQTVGTIGAARLGDTSVGYAHRSLSASWVMNAKPQEIEALSRKLAEQLSVGWDDVQFARQIATRYVERARSSAFGSAAVPANLASPEAASVLRDVLRSLSVGEQEIERAMGRFSRGGASHTKKRLDLDLSENVELPDGSSFPMMNAFETDQASMYMQYARRVSGDVALTQYGVMGDQGMKVLRKTMEFGPNGKKATADEMRAFDQIAAEFYGRPLDGTGNKYLGNLRMLTAASRLGGMAFTQFAEIANSVSLLGVNGALKQVAALPRLIADVHAGRPSELLKSIEQIGGPLGQDSRVVFPFQEPGDVKVYGRDSLNAFDRMVRAGSNALPWLSGWHHMHAAQVRGISEQIVHKAFRYINQGEESSALVSMGIGPDLVSRLRADMPNIATFNPDGTLASLNLTKATDHGAAAELVQAIHRGGKQIVQGTYIGETGRWAHSDLMRMLVQFRSFSIVAMEKQWTRQRVDEGTAKAFGILMGQMAFALPIHLSRVAINGATREDKEQYFETQLQPAMLARAVLNYTSISGLSGDVLDAGFAVMGGEASGVRSGSSSALGNIPALGYIESGAKVIKEKDAREAIRMLPGGNLPFITPVLNHLTD